MDVDLSRPMVLSRSQQTTLDLLSMIDLPDADPDVELDTLPTQPFVVPAECTREGSSGVPDRCRFRYVTSFHLFFLLLTHHPFLGNLHYYSYRIRHYKYLTTEGEHSNKRLR